MARQSLSLFLAALLAWPASTRADALSDSPSLEDALPAPSLTRDRLHAALERLRSGDRIVPAFPWPAGALARLPVLCLEDPSPSAHQPGVLLLESPDDPALQQVLRGVLAALPDELLSQSGTGASFSPASLKAFRENADPAARRAAADLLMKLGVFSAFSHFLLTAPAPPRAETWEDPAAFRRYRRARTAVHGRDQVLSYTDALSRALEPVEQRAFGLELWALEKNRAAFETGELSAPEYIRRLLDKTAALGLAPTAETRQARRIAELLSLEEGLDWRQALEERDGLVESLFNHGAGPDRTALLRETEALAAGRLSPAQHAARLLAARRAGVPGEDAAAAPAFRRFSQYADLAESVDLPALGDEVGRMEESLFGPARNTPVQHELLELARDLRALHRATAPAAAPENASRMEDFRGEDLWGRWRSLPDRAQALARTVELSTPRPSFPWTEALNAMQAAEQSLWDRGPLLVENALRNRNAKRWLFFVASPPLAAVAAEAFRKKGLRVLLISPLAEPSGIPPAATALAGAWGLRRLRWDDAELPGAARASDALAGSLLLLLEKMKPPPAAGTLPDAGIDRFLRRLRIRLKEEVLQRNARGGETRVSARGDGLAPVTLLWRWSAAGDALPPGFQEAGEVGEGTNAWRISFRPQAGLKGPWRWAAAQANAVKTATRRFLQMQKRATLLTGAWMAGGLLLSAFAGAVSVAFLVAWLAVGVGVLVGIVFFGRDASDREEWSENFKTIGRKRKAFMDRLFSSRSAEER